ncbi:hypothetical protein KC573_01415 [candidate division WWE3 bacterium]|uniref:Uncharacterized protein n=1 Tax=candidate division WWE3 bacterium TaxID=2053526 RepID=A0A955LWG0_UNCKA|nr:hypothetical protein [candidate division WWE3 bacterium]
MFIYGPTLFVVIFGFFIGLALFLLAIGALASMVGGIFGIPVISLIQNWVASRAGQQGINVFFIYLLASISMVFPFLFGVNYTAYVAVFMFLAAMLAAARKSEARAWSLATYAFAIVSFGSFIG